MSDLTVDKIEQLSDNTIGHGKDLNIPKQITYIDYINMLEKENQQLKKRNKELEAKVKHYEYILDDDLK